jgi:hypothetical protein
MLLASNADYQRGVDRRLAAGLIPPDQGEEVAAHWRAEGEELEAELAEFEAATESSEG